MLIKRKTALILAIPVLIGFIFLGKYLAGLKKEPARVSTENLGRFVLAQQANPGKQDLSLSWTGRLKSGQRVELFAETTGILAAPGFKTGQKFQSGAVIIRMDDTELRNNFLAQKSQFLTTLTSVLPDIQLDYPQEYPAFRNYMDAFKIQGALRPLPNAQNPALERFLSGRGLYTQYYNLKANETRLDKYIIKAPFTGEVADADLEPGTLIRQGQRLGVLIGTGPMEWMAGIPAHQARLIKPGSPVQFSTPEGESFKGQISRVGTALDPSLQTVPVFASVQGSGLRDGMYLRAEIRAGQVNGVVRVPRRMIQGGNSVFTVDSGVLVQKEVEVLREDGNDALVQGLAQGEWVLMSPVPGAYDGMKVRIKE